MSVTEVIKKIKSIYERRKASVYGLSLDYSARAINFFRSVQPPKPNSQGLFWHNRTGQAAARMFTYAVTEKDTIRWGMSHGVKWGIYLELANDRKDAAINPIMVQFTRFFIKDLHKLYKD